MIWDQSEGGNQCPCIFQAFLFSVALITIYCDTFVNFMIDFSMGLHIFFSVGISQWRLPVAMHWIANRSMDNCMMTWIITVNFVRVQTVVYLIVLILMLNDMGLF